MESDVYLLVFNVLLCIYMYKRPAESQNFKYLCCWCCKSGPITGIIRTSKSGYVAGESVVFDFVIQNHSRRVCGVTVLFVKVSSKVKFNLLQFIVLAISFKFELLMFLSLLKKNSN